MLAAPLPLLGSGPVTRAAVLFRMFGALNVTVIVKATFGLVHEGPVRPMEPDPVTLADQFASRSAGASLFAATDLAPHKNRVDITFVGHAYAPGAQALPAVAARLALFRDQALLDKTLRIYGDRSPERPTPLPFHKMPLVYERAYGGPTLPDNPGGMGGDERVRGGGAGGGLPNVVDATDPSRPGGFGPIPPTWNMRRRLLGGVDPAIFDTPIATLPSADVFPYFQVAPLDQQLDVLRGDETIVLDNLHPTLPRLWSRLPGFRGACRVYHPKADGYAAGKPVTMRLDTLTIDGDRQCCSLVFRGTFAVPEGERALPALRVACGVEAPGLPMIWPEPKDLVPPRSTSATQPAPAARRHAATVPLPNDAMEALRARQALPFSGQAPAPAAPPAPTTERADTRAGSARAGGTVAISEELQAALAAQRALPFDAAPPTLPPLEPLRIPAPAPAPPENPFEGTFTLDPHEAKHARQGLAERPTLPFVRGEADPDLLRAVRPASPRRDAPLTGTAPLTADDLAALTRVVPLPFRLPDAPSPPSVAPSDEPSDLATAPQRPEPRKLPRRRSPTVPVSTDLPLSVAALPFQVSPPRTSLTVIAKGTFDLVEGENATISPDIEPLLGDIYPDDDPRAAPIYPSDLAYFKPRCDVTVVGRAYPKAGPARQMQVGFWVGREQGKVERSANVLGDRTWSKTLGIAVAPSEPAAFESMPLTYSRAFGGPEFAANPVGTGHKSATDADGALRLPNVEDPARPITSPSDAPSAQCFAPLSPSWRPRARFQGTYDKRWLATRWPYFPDDYDWQGAQHAPLPQQVDDLAADAPYELRAMSRRAPVLRGNLPGFAVRCFAERATANGEDGGGFCEVPMKLDTVHFDLEAHKVVLVWRGLLAVSDDEAHEIAHLFLTAEPTRGPALTLDQARERMLDLLVPVDDGVAAPAPPPPAPAVDSGARTKVLAALAAGDDLTDVDLCDADLSELDFSGRSLAGALLLRTNLARATLDEARLDGAQLEGANLEGAQLVRASLDGADLEGVNLSGANLEGAALYGANFGRARAQACNLRGARGGQVSFVGADLSHAVLDEADLADADFSTADLSETSLVGANLPEVRLLDVRAPKARFDGATMPGARAESGAFSEASFRDVKAPRSGWGKANLEGASFVGAALPGAGFSGIQAELVNFSSADLTEARFRAAHLKGARFLGANLMKATFEEANLEGADLRGANLYEAETWKAKLDGANLELALVTRTKLAGKKG